MVKAPKCSCGGTLETGHCNDHVELMPIFGLDGVIEGAIPTLRCNRCGESTYESAVMSQMLFAVARAILTKPRRLVRYEARLLRKVLLGLTQEKLAKRMGINKITVADWERGERAISKEHDYELRGIALSTLFERLSEDAHEEREALTRDVTAVLNAPRIADPPKRTRRLRIDAVPVRRAKETGEEAAVGL